MAEENTMNLRSDCGGRNAFTLVEILAVIAIVTVLAAILIPATFSVREESRTATCLSNLRQIGVALQTYATDKKGRLPMQNWWNNGAAPAALSQGSSTDPDTRANGLGFLAVYGYLGGANGIAALGTPGKPSVLSCPNDEKFFLNSTAKNWCSYVYQSPHYASNLSTDTSKPNTVNELDSRMALVVDAGQVYSGNPAPHSGNLVAVLYGGWQVQLRPWRGSNGVSVEADPNYFDLAKNLR